ENLSVPVDFHTHCTPGYGLASSVMAMIHGVDILDTNIWWFGGGSAAPALELIYVFADRLGIEVDVNMEAVRAIRNELLSCRQELKQFDLATTMPLEFDPLTDTLPGEISAEFDRAIDCARNNDEEGLLNACHAIEEYFRFPKPNELVKNAEVPGGMYSNMVAQLKTLGASDLLDDAMRLIPKVRRDAGLVPLVTPTSQIVGSQAVSLAMDRKKGNPDYSNASNQFISLVKGEYGHTPVPVDPAFREKITGDAQEHPYDVNSYRQPENPQLDDLGGVKLASNDEEYLLLQLLPSVANGFLRRRRKEEFDAKQAEKATVEAPAAKEEEQPKEAEEPITGEVLSAPMGGRVIEVKVKAGDAVKAGQILLVYEAMKMENDVESPKAGTVKRVFVKPDDVVGTDAPLIEFAD
ncbi:MAG: biotin/lipoyl-binding protein, partial [Firmicutes bacterium]|nr:biotin/lipoyl-binding protein [Bacillota bacterium]